MKAHIFQHVPFESPGSIQAWLELRGARISFTRFFAGDALPALADMDLLIIMGGSMSVNDEASLPWLAAEKRFIADAIATGKAVVGICLGAQLIASSLGSRVYPGLQKEIGWFDIVARPVMDHETQLFRLPETTRVFHWHGETFAIPEGAIRLAGSKGCASQVFQVGRCVLGLQCHLETTPESADDIITHCREELEAAQGSTWVQSESEIRSEPTQTYATMNQLLAAMLDFVTRDSNRIALTNQ